MRSLAAKHLWPAATTRRRAWVLSISVLLGVSTGDASAAFSTVSELKLAGQAVALVQQELVRHVVLPVGTAHRSCIASRDNRSNHRRHNVNCVTDTHIRGLIQSTLYLRTAATTARVRSRSRRRTGSTTARYSSG